MGLLKRIVLLPRSFRFKIFRLKGKASGGMDFTLYYLGETEALEYLKSFYFSEVTSEYLGIFPFWELRKKIVQLHSLKNMVIVDINDILSFCIPAGGHKSFVWIKQKVITTGGIFGLRKPQIEGVYGRKVRKYKYNFKITKDRDDVLRFYNELYVPYINSRYKETAYVRSLDEISAVVRHGFILQVFDQEQVVSGLACVHHGDTLRVYAKGLAEDYEYHLKRGAHSACEYFLFKWAHENSINVIDLMRTRPNLADGVYEYKRKWCAYPEKDIWPHTSLWIFVPKEVVIPEVLKKQLIWDGKKFVTLKDRCVSL